MITEKNLGGTHALSALRTTFMPRLDRRAIAICVTALYVAALRYSYVDIIAPQFAYMHYAYRPVGFSVESINWALMLAPSFWLPLDCKRPSQMITWYLYLLVTIPGILIPQFALSVPTSELLALSLWLTLALHMVGLVPKLPIINMPRIRMDRRTFWIVFALFTLGPYGLVLFTFGASFAMPSFAKIYATRSAYKAQLENGGSLVGYAVLWLAEVINPLYIAVGLTRRRYWLVAAACAGQALLFATTAFKAIAVSSALLTVLVLILRREGQRLGLLLVGGCTALIMICAGLDRIVNTIVFTSVLVRRAIMTPGLLTGIYYEYFSQHQPEMFASSFLRPLLESRYSLPPAQMIGAIYFEGPQSNANANLWADAFANARYPGILFMTVALCAVLWLVDSCTALQRRKDAFLFVAVPALALCNSSLQTVFISHGLALVLIFSYLMPTEVREKALKMSSVCSPECVQ